jgi:hypothetical protein
MANVLFRRGTQEYINNNVPISDGQVVFNETDQAIYVDTPVNNVITRLRYGGGNLSRSDIDSALSDTSENPVQNKVITESVLQKTDIVNDYNTAVAVTATDIPVGCGVIKTANTKIGGLQTALNTTNGTVAQHTTDIASLNTGLAKLSDDLTWKHATNVLSDGSVDLTNVKYNELSIEVHDSTLNTIYHQMIPKVNIPSIRAYYYIGGYYSIPASNASVRLTISKTNVKVDEYYINGVRSSNTIALGVWYR